MTDYLHLYKAPHANDFNISNDYNPVKATYSTNPINAILPDIPKPSLSQILDQKNQTMDDSARNNILSDARSYFSLGGGYDNYANARKAFAPELEEKIDNTIRTVQHNNSIAQDNIYRYGRAGSSGKNAAAALLDTFNKAGITNIEDQNRILARGYGDIIRTGSLSGVSFSGLNERINYALKGGMKEEEEKVFGAKAWHDNDFNEWYIHRGGAEFAYGTPLESKLINSSVPGQEQRQKYRDSIKSSEYKNVSDDLYHNIDFAVGKDEADRISSTVFDKLRKRYDSLHSYEKDGVGSFEKFTDDVIHVVNLSSKSPEWIQSYGDRKDGPLAAWDRGHGLAEDVFKGTELGDRIQKVSDSLYKDNNKKAASILSPNSSFNTFQIPGSDTNEYLTGQHIELEDPEIHHRRKRLENVRRQFRYEQNKLRLSKLPSHLKTISVTGSRPDGSAIDTNESYWSKGRIYNVDSHGYQPQQYIPSDAPVTSVGQYGTKPNIDPDKAPKATVYNIDPKTGHAVSTTTAGQTAEVAPAVTTAEMNAQNTAIKTAETSASTKTQDDGAKPNTSNGEKNMHTTQSTNDDINKALPGLKNEHPAPSSEGSASQPNATVNDKNDNPKNTSMPAPDSSANSQPRSYDDITKDVSAAKKELENTRTSDMSRQGAENILAHPEYFGEGERASAEEAIKYHDAQDKYNSLVKEQQAHPEHAKREQEKREAEQARQQAEADKKEKERLEREKKEAAERRAEEERQRVAAQDGVLQPAGPYATQNLNNPQNETTGKPSQGTKGEPKTEPKSVLDDLLSDAKSGQFKTGTKTVSKTSLDKLKRAAKRAGKGATLEDVVSASGIPPRQQDYILQNYGQGKKGTYIDFGKIQAEEEEKAGRKVSGGNGIMNKIMRRIRKDADARNHAQKEASSQFEQLSSAIKGVNGPLSADKVNELNDRFEGLKLKNGMSQDEALKAAQKFRRIRGNHPKLMDYAWGKHLPQKLVAAGLIYGAASSLFGDGSRSNAELYSDPF